MHEANNVRVVWGTFDDDSGSFPEPAIAIVRYGGVICLEQEDRSINVAYRDVPALLKALREAHKAGDPTDAE